MLPLLSMPEPPMSGTLACHADTSCLFHNAIQARLRDSAVGVGAAGQFAAALPVDPRTQRPPASFSGDLPIPCL